MKRPIKLVTLFAILIIIFTGCASDPSVLKESDAYYKEGLSYLANDTQKAFVSFQKSIQLDPKNRDAHYALGHIYFIQGRNDKARDEFKRVIRISRDDSEAHNYLGKVYEREGKWDEAIHEYKEALKNPLYPTPDIPHYNLGIALMNKGDSEGALKELNEAVKVNQNHVLAHYEMGKIYLQKKLKTEAKKEFEAVIKLAPGSEIASNSSKQLDGIKE